MPVADKAEYLLGEFLGGIRSMIFNFFAHTALLVWGFFLQFFQNLLPMIVAGIIIYRVLHAVAWAVRATARWLGWMDPSAKVKVEWNISKVKENESAKNVPLNNSNDNLRRVEIEIEFLEEMLRVRREKLKKLD